MSDYISREAALNLIKELHAEAESPEASEALFEAHERTADLPAADVKPVVRGEWIGEHIRFVGWDLKCPKCGEEPDYFISGFEWEVAVPPNFCPNCGADMRKNDAD